MSLYINPISKGKGENDFIQNLSNNNQQDIVENLKSLDNIEETNKQKLEPEEL